MNREEFVKEVHKMMEDNKLTCIHCKHCDNLWCMYHDTRDIKENDYCSY